MKCGLCILLAWLLFFGKIKVADPVVFEWWQLLGAPCTTKTDMLEGTCEPIMLLDIKRGRDRKKR